MHRTLLKPLAVLAITVLCTLLAFWKAQKSGPRFQIVSSSGSRLSSVFEGLSPTRGGLLSLKLAVKHQQSSPCASPSGKRTLLAREPAWLWVHTLLPHTVGAAPACEGVYGDYSSTVCGCPPPDESTLGITNASPPEDPLNTCFGIRTNSVGCPSGSYCNDDSICYNPATPGCEQQ
jgi:hypothetical protein